ncbi:MAG: hypothetical protein ACR2NY_03640 [Alphaproteobacteria bacterium]
MATIYKLPCPSCQKNATVASGLLTTRFQRVRCPYCFYEWQANKGMLLASDVPSAKPHLVEKDMAKDKGKAKNVNDLPQMPSEIPAPVAAVKNTAVNDAADDDMLSLDISRMSDTDYQTYQANQDRLKTFKKKMKNQSPYLPSHRRVDWFTIIGLLLGLAVAGFLLLVLMIIFHEPIVNRIPQAEEFYHWLSYIIGKLERGLS